MANVKPVYDRLHLPYGRKGVDIKHMRSLIDRLHKSYGGPEYNGSRDEIFRSYMVNHIKTNYSQQQIERAHFDLVQQYARNPDSGERAFIGGRTPGARNREQQNYDIDRNQSFAELQKIAGQPLPEIDYAKGNDVLEDMLPSEDKSQSPPQDNKDYVLRYELNAYARQLELANFVSKAQLLEISQKFDATVMPELNRLDTAIKNIQLNQPTIIEIKKPDVPKPINIGVQHKHFPELLAFCSATTVDEYHLNIWIHGPAGTGKSTACKNVHKAIFGDKYPFRTNGKMSYAHELMGHMHGDKYITTEFRKAYEHGGVYCADEIDGWLPDALIALNGALANGIAAFPDGMISRHKDFVFIGAANTVGLSGTIEYVSRFKQDAAFMDRNVMLDWPLDEALEASMSTNPTWLEIVRKVRSNVANYKIGGHLITPRAVVFGEALLRAGCTLERAMDAALRKGMTETQWRQATQGVQITAVQTHAWTPQSMAAE